MSASRRDKLVSLQRNTPAADSHNEDIPAWGEIGKEWARITFGPASERRAAAQEQSNQTITFDLPANSLTQSLKATDRINWNGVSWDLVAPGIPKGQGELQFTAIGATP